MTAATVAQRVRGWREDGRPPITVWNRMGRRRLVIGGGRTRGWTLVPRLTLDPRRLTLGVTWQSHAFEDPHPLLLVHVPAAYLWVRVYPVHAGCRSTAGDQRDRPGEAGDGGGLG